MQQIKTLIKKTLYIMDHTQKILCVLVFFLTGVGSILELLGVSAIIPLVSVIQNPNALLDSKYLRNFEILHELSNNQLVALIGGGTVALYVIKNLYFIFLAWLRTKFACKIEREMSIRMLTSYFSRGYQFFLDTTFGKFQRGVTGDAAAVYTVLFSIFRLVSESLTIGLICIFMFLADWEIALMVMILAFICLLLIFFGFRKSMYENGKLMRHYSSRVNQALAQSFQGIKDVLLLRKQTYFIYDFESNRIETQKAQCKQAVAGESPAYIIEGICVSGLLFMVCIKIIYGDIDDSYISILASFAVGAFRILPALGKISTSLNSLTASLPSIDALYEQVVQAENYAKTHPEAVVAIEQPKTKYGLISRGRRYTDLHRVDKYNGTDMKFHTELELRNISFMYNEELGYVLRNINLKIKKGQAVAFIGASGAGKSTLVDVLLGLLIPQEGAIYMDGTKITDVPDKWADTVGYVPQSVFLTGSSIKENVAFGERTSEIDEERVKEALNRAELGEFIGTLPKGIETLVGDRGVRLSGGQRQRIAIARALYHRPEILVLDEATSALDNETETAIMSAIDSLQGQVTMVIVAHRLTTVKNCDIIYEVNHTELIIRDKEEVLNKA